MPPFSVFSFPFFFWSLHVLLASPPSLLSFPLIFFLFWPLFKVLTWSRVIFPNHNCGFIHPHRYDCHPRVTHSMNPNAALWLFGGKGKPRGMGFPSPQNADLCLQVVLTGLSEPHSAWWDSFGDPPLTTVLASALS